MSTSIRPGSGVCILRPSRRKTGWTKLLGSSRRPGFAVNSDVVKPQRDARPLGAGLGVIHDRLDELEAQSIFIFREAFAGMRKLALLWSLGKDSNVMIWLARKAFFGHVPFPVMHVDTGKKFPEMYAFSRSLCRRMGTHSHR